MDDIPREMQKFADRLQKKGHSEQINSAIPKAIDEKNVFCIETSKDNDDRYIECMQKYVKKMSKEENRFQLRLSFANLKLQQCLKQEFSAGKNIEKCHQEGLARADQYVQEYLKNIKQ